MISYEDITREYITTAKKWGESPDSFPISLVPNDHGQEHLEISKNGIFSLIVTERGKITKKRSTRDQAELLYWVFADRAFAKGWGYSMKNKKQDEDFRRIAFNHALENMRKLSKGWHKKFQQEIDEILKDNPYVNIE